jgi:hypothetical protein
MNGHVAVLPHGLWQDGRLARTLALRAINGGDELALEEAVDAGAVPAELALLLLERLSGAPAAALVAGDIEVTLRAVHAATLGPEVELAMACPAACGETLEVALPLAALAVAVPDPPENGRYRLGSDDVRLPTGGDLAWAARAADPAEALAAAIGLVSGDDAVEAALARLDPNAECLIDAACPACGAPVQLAVDSLALLLRGLAHGGGILAQVDRLARTYGWSEDAILALPRRRRQRYLALIDA